MAHRFSEEFRSHDPTYRWKLVLRLLCITLAFLGISMTAWAMNYEPTAKTVSTEGENYNRYSDIAYPGPMPYVLQYYLSGQIAALGLSMLWNVANIVVLIKRRGRYIAPGANVACDLLLWMALLVTSFFASATGAIYVANYQVASINESDNVNGATADHDHTGVYANGTLYYTASNGTNVALPNTCRPFVNCAAANHYNAAMLRIAVVLLMAVAFSLLILLSHFALFISACRYTHQRRLERKARGRRGYLGIDSQDKIALVERPNYGDSRAPSP